MVARGQFRSDLYYRLNVFPIVLPALRERRGDISALVTHFVKLFSRRMGKQVDSIPTETMAAFQWHSWPGNIRELQNLVETRGDPFAGRLAPKPTPQKANRAHHPQSASHPTLLFIDDHGRLGSRFDCGNVGAGRLDRRRMARRSGETGTETNHAACQDEKDGDLATDRSGGNRRARCGMGGCSDLKASLPFPCRVASGGRGRPLTMDEGQRFISLCRPQPKSCKCPQLERDLVLPGAASR
jgi:hypothetical protein